MNSKYLRLGLFLVIILGITLFYQYGGKEYLSLDYIKSNYQEILNLYERRPFFVISIFMGIYVLLTSLSIPGSIVLTLLAGAVFGVTLGSLLVAVASSLGATVSFVMAKFLFKDFVMRNFGKQYYKINLNIKHHGHSYLFTLRLLPASPFVVINLVMGLTTMPIWTFFWITIIGMAPGTVIYVYAGRKFAELESLAGIMSPPIIISLVSLSLIPYIWKFILRQYHQRRVSWN